MNIRQEENTPLGDYFHDNGFMKIFNAVSEIVDEFDVDTDQLNFYCDEMIAKFKGLKSLIKKAEAEYTKIEMKEKLKNEIRNYD